MAGRPAYEPNEADRNAVRIMAATGVPQGDIRRCLGVGGIAEKTLRKHFREELDTARTKADAAVKASVFQRAVAGEGWACALWLKRTPSPSAGDSFREPTAMALKNKAGETMFTLTELDDLIAKAESEAATEGTETA